MPRVHTITSMEPPPSHEFEVRKWTYLAMMGVRAAAIVVAVFVPGIWRWFAIAAGIMLPYLAVVLVNAAHTKGHVPVTVELPPDDRPPLPGRPILPQSD